MRLAALCLAAWIAARWRAVGHAPWSDMYEFTIAFASAMAFFYIIFDRLYLSSGRLRSAQALGAALSPVILAMLLVAALFFPRDVRPLVPALQNQHLLAIHVATMILAYGAFSISFGSMRCV